MYARLTFLGLLLIALVLPGPLASLRADEAIIVTAQQAGVQRGGDTRKSPVDEVALRYYASLNQRTRVEAETRRLRRLHPEWKPPSDLWTSRPGNPEDGVLWELFAADKLKELRASIRALQAKNSNWRVSTDLEQKLRRKELRASIMTDARSTRWNEVAAAANNWRTDVDTGEVEILWQIAEGYARTRRAVDARQVLESILRTSSEPRERIATIHKALALLPMKDAERLIQMGRIDSSGKSEFDVISIDVTRARLSALLHDAPGRDISAQELARFQEYALSSSDPNQAALIAWYAMQRNDVRDALEHFKSAIAMGGDATVAHGLAHTLRKLGRLREAEEVAYAWREPSPANAILFIDILAEQLTQGSVSFEPNRLARYAAVTLQTASGEGAQALAWYAFNSCQMEAAAEWFSRAIAWFPKESTALGYALTLRRLKRNQEFIDIVNRYDGLFPIVVSLLFPDGSGRADDPCDRKSVKTVNVKSDSAGVIYGSSAMTSGVLQYQTAPRSISRQGVWSTVPMPSKVGSEQTQQEVGPKSTEFPIAVAPENPSRPQSGDRIVNLKTSAGSWRSSGTTVAVVSARRVLGVGPMPYERFGRALLPAWNGTQQPAVSSELMLRSPRGTQWLLEQAAIESPQSAISNPASMLPGVETTKSVDATARFHP